VRRWTRIGHKCHAALGHGYEGCGFLALTQCRLEAGRRFGGTYHFHLQSPRVREVKNQEGRRQGYSHPYLLPPFLFSFISILFCFSFSYPSFCSSSASIYVSPSLLPCFSTIIINPSGLVQAQTQIFTSPLGSHCIIFSIYFGYSYAGVLACFGSCNYLMTSRLKAGTIRCCVASLRALQNRRLSSLYTEGQWMRNCSHTWTDQSPSTAYIFGGFLRCSRTLSCPGKWSIFGKDHRVHYGDCHSYWHLGMKNYPDDGGSVFLWNIGNDKPDYTASHPTRH
jgi:hypothetical protein